MWKIKIPFRRTLGPGSLVGRSLSFKIRLKIPDDNPSKTGRANLNENNPHSPFYWCSFLVSFLGSEKKAPVETFCTIGSFEVLSSVTNSIGVSGHMSTSIVYLRCSVFLSLFCRNWPRQRVTSYWVTCYGRPWYWDEMSSISPFILVWGLCHVLFRRPPFRWKRSVYPFRGS